MFKVGQKVVCIDDFDFDGLRRKTRIQLPIKGEIYTIRELHSFPNGDLGLRLCEIVNPVVNYDDGKQECTFNSHGFRPVDETFGEAICESLEVMTEPELV